MKFSTPNLKKNPFIRYSGSKCEPNKYNKIVQVALSNYFEILRANTISIMNLIESVRFDKWDLLSTIYGLSCKKLSYLRPIFNK